MNPKILNNLLQRLSVLEKKVNSQVNANISLPNDMIDALTVEKEGKKMITIDTVVGNEKIHVNRKTIFNETTHIGSLIINNNRIMTKNNEVNNNICLCPGENGNVIIMGNPKNDMSAVNKKYVDHLLRGFKLADPVKVKTTDELPCHKIYENNPNKIIGEKISLNTYGIDGFNGLQNNDRIIVSTSDLIGIYIIESIGNEIIPWCLNKTSDKIEAGLYTRVEHGNTCGQTGWILVNDDNTVNSENSKNIGLNRRNENKKCKFVKFSGEENLIFSNVGDGYGILKNKCDSHVKFKSINSDNLRIYETENSIKINLDDSKIDIAKLIKQNNERQTGLKINDDILINKVLDSNTVILSGDNKRIVRFHLDKFPINSRLDVNFPTSASKNPIKDVELVGKNTYQTMMNKEFVDTLTWFCDDFNKSKKMRFQLTNIPNDSTVVLTCPSYTTEIMGTTSKQDVLNKTFDMPTTSLKYKNNLFKFNFSKKKTSHDILFPSTDAELVNVSSNQYLTNKTFEDTNTTLFNPTLKAKLKFSLHNLSRGTTSILTIPNESTEIAGTTANQELKNKTIDYSKNNIIELRVNNYNATKNPTVNHNASDNYLVGSRWINISSLEEFVCVNSNDKNAMWRKTT